VDGSSLIVTTIESCADTPTGKIVIDKKSSIKGTAHSSSLLITGVTSVISFSEIFLAAAIIYMLEMPMAVPGTILVK